MTIWLWEYGVPSKKNVMKGRSFHSQQLSESGFKCPPSFQSLCFSPFLLLCQVNLLPRKLPLTRKLQAQPNPLCALLFYFLTRSGNKAAQGWWATSHGMRGQIWATNWPALIDVNNKLAHYNARGSGTYRRSLKAVLKMIRSNANVNAQSNCNTPWPGQAKKMPQAKRTKRGSANANHTHSRERDRLQC